jgi:hypothetical protein
MNPNLTTEEFNEMVAEFNDELNNSINLFNKYANIFYKIIDKIHDRIPDGDGKRGVLLSTRENDKLRSLWIASGPMGPILYERTYTAESDNTFATHIEIVNPHEVFTFYNAIECINIMIATLQGKRDYIIDQKIARMELEAKLPEIKEQYN